MQNRRCQLFCSLLLLMWDFTIALQIPGFGGSAVYFSFRDKSHLVALAERAIYASVTSFEWLCSFE